MDKRIYAIFDVQTGAYGNPMFLTSDGEAIRVVSDAVNDKDQRNNLANHSEDFRLDMLGHMDYRTGKITSLDVPLQLMQCAQLKKVGN